MRNWLLLGMAALFGACGGSQCGTPESCTNDPNCQCWCSVKCGYRKKNSSDSPVYFKDDPNGKHCYCKQWDYDHYKDNCVEHKNLKETGQ